MLMQTQSAEKSFLGCTTRILTDGSATSGALGLVDMQVPAGHMPPLHVHRAEDEGFYVIDGEVTLFVPGEQITLTAGDFFLAPRGVPHSYRVGDRPARWLVASTPAGFERFVCDVADSGDLDPGALTALAAKYEIEILGPPGTLP